MKLLANQIPSGTDWLGTAPAHWAPTRIKFVSSINNKTLADTTDPDYMIRYIDIGGVTADGAIANTPELAFKSAPSRARRVVVAGDTIVSTVRTYLRAIAHFENPSDNVICSTGFAVLSPGRQIVPNYLYRVMQSEPYISEIVRRSTGVSYPAINASEIGNLKLFVPPVAEQWAIVSYLESMLADTNALIAEKERLIALLQEQRQAIITEAVTKGLDPNVPMKDSGVEWAGQVPEHWVVGPLRWLGKVRSGDFFSKEHEREHGIPVIGGNGIMTYGESANVNLPTIAIGRVGALCGNVHLVVVPSWITDNALYFTEINPAITVEYLYFALTSLRLNRLASQTAQPLITGEIVKQQLVIYPSWEEQKMIVQWINRQLDRIDSLIEKVEITVTKLHSYRESLITEAVTGKIDVRREVQ